MKRHGAFALAFHVLFIAFMLAPLAVVVLVAFTPEGYLSLSLQRFSLRWFWAILDNPDFVSSFWISIYLALAAATLSLAIALPAALAVARFRFPGRDALSALLVSPLMIPSVVLGVAFLRFLSLAQLAGTFAGLVLCHVVLCLPFVFRMVLASLAGRSMDCERAAISLGASDWTAFRRITVPLIMPGLIAGWVLAFIHSFDELTVTVFVASPSTTTLPVRLFSHISQTTDPLVTSVSTVIMAISLVLLLVLDLLYGVDRLLMGAAR